MEPWVIFAEGVLRRFRDAAANGAVAAGHGALTTFSADGRKGLSDIGPMVARDGP